MQTDHPTDDPLVNAKTVKREFDDPSDMTLWRWLQDEELGFPQPTYIRGRRYWRWSAIQSFKEAVST